MNSLQIYNEILMLSEVELLKTLPTAKRKICIQCKTIDIRERKDETFYYNNCRKPVETEIAIWYYKNKTIDPELAVERHKIFWSKIYRIELAKELFLKAVNR